MEEDHKEFSRRKFMKNVAAATLVSPLTFNLSAFAGAQKEKLAHACIGVGGMGGHDLQQFLSHPRVEVVAICDVDENTLKKAAELVPNARTYTDWRELLKKESKIIDSVNVSVPDHNHFIISNEAIRKGKHLYCQKPMCHDVAEIRQLTQAAAKADVVTQLGTQHASGEGDRTAVELIKKGVIGKIKQVYLCSNRPGATEAYRFEGPRPAAGEEPPSHLHWDLWIGTAPMRPYVPEIYHPAKWRAWQDFGTGWSGDIGCHIFDAVWKGLELHSPLSVKARVQESWKDSPARRKDTWPQSNHITWIFPGNSMTSSRELQIEWFDGEFYPPESVRALYPVEEYPAESAMLIGTEGALLIPHTKMPVLLPVEKFESIQFPNVPPRNHYHHFVDACMGGEKTASDFAQSGPMTEAIILGTVALREPGIVLEWDAKKMRILNYPEAEKHLRRDYRKGWNTKNF